MVAVAQKLSMAEQRLQEQSCLFQTGDYRNKGTTPKSFLCSIPSKDVFCGSETKHERSMVPRQKLFLSARKLQKQKPQCYKSVLGSSPGEDVFSSSKTIKDRSMTQRTKFLVLARILQKLRSQT
jgi:hypothetical protein